MNLENKILQVCFDILEKEKTPLEAQKEIFRLFNVVGRSEQCSGCEESTGETKLWCCNHCGKRVESF